MYYPSTKMILLFVFGSVSYLIYRLGLTYALMQLSSVYVPGGCVFRDVITDNATCCAINFILRENRAEY